MSDLTLRFGAEENVTDTTKAIADGIDDLGDKLKDTGEKAKTSSEKVGTFGDKAKTAGTAVVVLNQGLELAGKAWGYASQAIGPVVNYLREAVDAAANAERSQRLLEAALGDNAGAIGAVTAEIQRKTGADADALNSQAAWLQAIGLTSDQIAQALPAIQAWSDVTGKDATAAMRKLEGAIKEGRVGEQIAEFARFSAAAEAQTGTFAGELRKLTSELGELQETIGGGVTGSERLTGSLKLLSEAVRETNDEAADLDTTLGNLAAEGIEKAVSALSLAASGTREMIEPTGAWGVALNQLVGSASPATQAIARLWNLFGEDSEAAKQGLDQITGRTERLAEALDKVPTDAKKDNTDPLSRLALSGPDLTPKPKTPEETAAEKAAEKAAEERARARKEAEREAARARKAEADKVADARKALDAWDAERNRSSNSEIARLEKERDKTLEVAEAAGVGAEREKEIREFYGEEIAAVEDKIRRERLAKEEEAGARVRMMIAEATGDKRAMLMEASLAEVAEVDKQMAAGLIKEEEYQRALEAIRKRYAHGAAKIAADEAKVAVDESGKAAKEVQGVLGEINGWASLGSNAMGAFVQGMHAESHSDRMKGMLKGVLTVIGGVLGAVFGGGLPGATAGAGLGGTLGSMFGLRTGGAVQGYDLPKARRGAVILGNGIDADGKVIEGHIGEGVLTRDAVARNGGIDEVMRQNAGAPPSGGPRGGDTHVTINALDPTTALGVVKERFDPIVVSRMTNRQGRLAAALRKTRRRRSS